MLQMPSKQFACVFKWWHMVSNQGRGEDPIRLTGEREKLGNSILQTCLCKYNLVYSKLIVLETK